MRGPDLNRRPSGYEPDELPSCSTPRPYFIVKHNESYKIGATHEVRTRDLNLGKVALYQLS
ncbi:hypothetical protein VHARVF571_450050 [Vibrio harveyi]|nr:hypothetical protein TH15OA1_390001 [Vibrio harveyi]CAH1537576.1 hypothetical protein VHARVF571_450050 [Vibrio harveyi]